MYYSEIKQSSYFEIVCDYFVVGTTNAVKPFDFDLPRGLTEVTPKIPIPPLGNIRISDDIQAYFSTEVFQIVSK